MFPHNYWGYLWELKQGSFPSLWAKTTNWMTYMCDLLPCWIVMLSNFEIWSLGYAQIQVTMMLLSWQRNHGLQAKAGIPWHPHVFRKIQHHQIVLGGFVRHCELFCWIRIWETGAWALEMSYEDYVCFCIFHNSGNNVASWKAWRQHNCYHNCQCTRPAHVATMQPHLGSLPKLNKVKHFNAHPPGMHLDFTA